MRAHAAWSALVPAQALKAKVHHGHSVVSVGAAVAVFITAQKTAAQTWTRSDAPSAGWLSLTAFADETKPAVACYPSVRVSTNTETNWFSRARLEPLGRPVCRDRKDDKFIEAALTARARLLIAQDADLPDLEKSFGVEMVTPRQFLARLPRHIRRRLA